MSTLEIVALPNGAFEENCYLVYDPDHPETVLVDPGEETDRFLAEAERRGRRITSIWITHAHIDHIQGLARVRNETGAPIYLHPDDLSLYEGLPEQGLWVGMRLEAPPPPDFLLTHGMKLQVGSTSFVVRHLPGHSPGHVCFVADGRVLGGDVLFAGSIGRTDLPGGNHELLIAGIRRELLSLPDETVVYPGHGGQTTVGREREHNPFLVSAVPG